MMLLRLNLFGMLMLWCCWLMDVKGQDVCQSSLTQRINLTTELQSEILLPCYFEAAAFIETIQTSNASVVWTHINETSQDIVEITFSGEVHFWTNRQGTIKADSNCILRYMEINISLAPEVLPINNWLLMLGGGVLLCLVTACVLYRQKVMPLLIRRSIHQLSIDLCHESIFI